PPWTLQQLTQRLGIPMHAVNGVLDALEGCGLLIRSHDDPPAYLPARDLADVSVAELMSAIREAGEDRFLDPESLSIPAQAEELEKRVERAIASSLEHVSVKALVAEGSPNRLRKGTLAEVAEGRPPGEGSIPRGADPARRP